MDNPLKFGPDLTPLKNTMNYLVALIEAIAVKVGVDISQLPPPPPPLK